MGVSYNCKLLYNIAWKHGYITPTTAFLATAVSYGCIFLHWPSLFKHATFKGAAYVSTALTCFIKFHNFFKKTLAWRHIQQPQEPRMETCMHAVDKAAFSIPVNHNCKLLYIIGP
jgi:hypothetical protein